MTTSCFAAGTVEHEVMHALGIIHEHQRPDSDDYINLNRENIPKLPVEFWLESGHSFELESIMNYGGTSLPGYLTYRGRNVASIRDQYLESGENPTWHSNFKTTTTDMLQIDHMYCRNRQNFQSKETYECQTADRFGTKRPVFKDRLCDGYNDCSDGSDEGEIKACKALGGRTADGCCSTYKTVSPYNWQFPQSFVWDQGSARWIGPNGYHIKENSSNKWAIFIPSGQGYYTQIFGPPGACPDSEEDTAFVCVVRLVRTLLFKIIVHNS